MMATRGLITWVLVWVAHDRMRRERDGEGSAGDSGRTFMHVFKGVTGHSELKGRPGGARAALAIQPDSYSDSQLELRVRVSGARECH